MSFGKSYICSNQLDVQETNLSFTQFNRIRNHLFGRWIEIIRALFFKLCDPIVSVFGSVTQTSDRTGRPVDTERSQKSQGKTNVLKTIDCVPSNVQSSRQEALLYVFEDNEAVIKMIMKGRSPTMRHVSRSHRVALDLLFDRINLDPKSKSNTSKPKTNSQTF